MKLKTLKDLQVTPHKALRIFEDRFKEKPELDSAVLTNELKAEAIKHLKEIEKKWEKYHKGFTLGKPRIEDSLASNLRATSNWIREFFNITQTEFFDLVLTNTDLKGEAK